jgi:alkylation response protein AidB-like acyl-CoA dehydrogenase
MPAAEVLPEKINHQSNNPDQDPLTVARELAKEFAATAAERDDRGGTAWHERDRIRKSGLLKLIIPTSLGGSGFNWPTALEVVRTVATADGSLGHVLGFHYLVSVVPHLIGSEEQRRFYYRQTAEGNWFWGNAFNPPLVSSVYPDQIVGWKVVITPDGDAYRLNGTNFYCSGATGSDILVISALKPGIDRLTRSFVVGAIPTNREGVTIHNDWNNFGQRQTDSGSVSFQDVRVQKEELFLEPGPFRQAFATLRTCISQLTLTNVYLGLAQGAFSSAKQFVPSRAQAWINSGLQDPTEDPYILRHFGEFWVELEGARLLANRAAESLQNAWVAAEGLTAEERGSVAVDIATAKVAAIRCGLRITSEIFEVMGARATKTKDRFDRFWRNLRTHSLHDPIDYKLRDLGRWALKDEAPKPGFYT